MCGPVTRPDQLRLDPEVAERLEQRSWPPAPARRCRAWRPRRSSGSGTGADGTRHSKSGSSVIVRAVAALRREVVGPDLARAGAAGGASLGSTGCRRARSLGSARPRSAWIGGASTWVARITSSDVSGSGGNSGSRSRARPAAASAIGGGSRRARRLRGGAAIGRLGRRAAGTVSGEIAGGALERPRVPATPAPVARITPAERGAGDEDHAREEQEHREDVARRAVESRCEETHSSRLPDDAAARLERRRAARTRRSERPGPSPSVPAASASVIAAVRQIAPVRSGRAGGRSSRISTEPPPITSAAGIA